jgi:hypothetical protein
MRYGTTSKGTRTFCLAAVLWALPLLILSAQETSPTAALQSAEWERSFEKLYDRALADKPLRPSPLALKIARATSGQQWAGLEPSQAVEHAFEMAMEAEKSLRFGVSAQETRAVLGQRAAIEQNRKNERTGLKELEKGRTWDSQRKNRTSGKTAEGLGAKGSAGQKGQADSLQQNNQNSQGGQGANQGGQGPGQNGAPREILLHTDPPSW